MLFSDMTAACFLYFFYKKHISGALYFNDLVNVRINKMRAVMGGGGSKAWYNG